MRRRYLLACLSPQYRNLFFANLFHDIIPNTIGDRNARNNGKTKIVKIEGNGEIENQLIEDSVFETGAGLLTTYGSFSVSNKIIAYSFSANGSPAILYKPISGVVGHKYLIIEELKADDNVVSQFYWDSTVYQDNNLTNKWQTFAVIANFAGTGTINFNFIRCAGNVSAIVYLRNGRLIDLTIEFGTGNEPTSLDDKRIKRIIKKGFRPHNTGTYNSTTIQEIETSGFNIWNEEWELGNIDPTTGAKISASDTIRSKNYIKVLPNTTYYFKNDAIFVYEYDENFNLVNAIGGLTNTTRTTKSNTAYLLFRLASSYGTTYNHDICINRSGERNGEYVPHRWQDFYQRVEYLESHGTEYIDSGLLAKDTLGFNFDLSTDFLQDQIFFGRQSFFQLGANTNASATTSAYWGWQSVNTSGAYRKSLTANVKYNFKHNFKNSRKALFDNVEYPNLVENYSTLSASTEHTICILARREATGNVQYYTQAKLYSFQITDEQTLVRNFIPVYRKADKVAGLYDLVNDVFYTNQGTGAFDVGADVPNDNVIQLPQPLKLDGAINAHNTFEITKDNYVFTRNVWNYTFTGNEDWAYTGSYFTILNGILNALPQTTNLLCSNKFSFAGIGQSSVSGDNQYYSGLSNIGFRYDNASGNVNTFKAYIAGVSIIYPLATPQVITIPKKHLGCVRLKDLNWGTETNNRFIASLPNSKQVALRTLRMYCARYVTKMDGESFENDWERVIYNGNNQDVLVHDRQYQNVPAFVASLTDDDILFFETQNEVEDFLNEATYQKGGTINGLQPNIPVEYQEVEYIQSSGTEYIDTQAQIGKNLDIEIKYSFVDTSTTQVIFGKRTPWLSIACHLNYFNFSYTTANDNHEVIDTLANIDANVHTLKLSNSGVYFDNVFKTSLSFIDFYDTNKIYTPFIFARRHSDYGNAELYAKARVYALKIKDAGILLRDFIPCYRKSDNAIGLYDKVEGKFYTNQGTGTFLKGANVNGAYDCEVLPNYEGKFQVK